MRSSIRQNLLKANDDDGKILIVNEDTDLSNYEGNWIKQTDDTLEIQSFGTGEINIEFLENHEILNTDNKDLMSAQITYGDGLKIESRDHLELIPIVTHISSQNGDTTIQNDGLEFYIDDDDLYMEPPKSLADEDFAGKYQSVAFEIQSDSSEIDTKLRINSYRQFDILSKDSKSLVSWNKFELPVSAHQKDNELQTIAQLREKYPGVKFKISRNKAFNEENAPPYLYHLLDNLYGIYPQAIEDFDEIRFSNGGPSVIQIPEGPAILNVGLKFLKASDETYSLRESNPFQILTHEYEHRLDGIIKEEEIKFIRSLNDPDLNILISNYETVRDENIRKLEANDYKKDDAVDLTNSIGKIGEVYYEKYGTRLLQHEYNNLVINAANRIDSNPSSRAKFEESLKGILVKLDKAPDINEMEETLSRILEKNIGLTLQEYFGELEHESSTTYMITDSSRINQMAGLIQYGYLPDLDFSKFSKEDSNKVTEIRKNTKFISELEEGIRTGMNSQILLSDLNSLYWKIPEEKEYLRNYIDQETKETTGVAFAYAFLNSNPTQNNIYYGDFSEYSSTLGEQRLEHRIINAHSTNPAISDIYRKGTQISFDSGKINVMEYKVIMGRNSCEEDDCLDKRCIEYDFLCCKDYPTSPHC